MKLADIIKSGGIVIHTPKKEQAIFLEKEFDKLGLAWQNGDIYGEDNASHWHFFKEETCYEPHAGSFNRKGFYKAQRYLVVEFEGVNFNTTTYKLIDIIKNHNHSKTAIHVKNIEQLNKITRALKALDFNFTEDEKLWLASVSWTWVGICIAPQPHLFGSPKSFKEHGFNIIEMEDMVLETPQTELPERNINLNYKNLYQEECRKVDEANQKLAIYDKYLNIKKVGENFCFVIKNKNGRKITLKEYEFLKKGGK